MTKGSLIVIFRAKDPGVIGSKEHPGIATGLRRAKVEKTTDE